MKKLLYIVPCMFLFLGCSSRQAGNSGSDTKTVKLDLNAFPLIETKKFQVSYYFPEDSPKYATFIDQMKPLDSIQCALLDCIGQEVATGFQFKINDKGAIGVVYGSKHSYGWWEYNLVVFDSAKEEPLSKPFPLATSEGDAGEGLYTDSWIEDRDDDGVPEIIQRTCTFLWPGADNFDPSEIDVSDPVLYAYSNGEYKEKSSFKDAENAYLIRAIQERDKAIKDESR
jgi:hypothetical protein